MIEVGTRHLMPANVRRSERFTAVYLPTDDVILNRFRSGKDTAAMAKEFWVPESEIANRLARVLENDRVEREWA